MPLSLEDNTAIHYYISEFYNPQGEGGVRYNDLLFSFGWPAVVISPEDASWPDFTPLPHA